MTFAGGSDSPVEYHHATKHAFGRFARSLGYLDWASQPSPFRRFEGAPFAELPREPSGDDVGYSSLYAPTRAEPVTFGTIGSFLRFSLGLSAWKSHGRSRWALRVNPSSGNLHPTEGYLVWNGGVHHYAPAEHGLEERARFAAGAPPRLQTTWADQQFLVALTSIHWREAWKYGERAFRYCQHDAGHALGALRFSAAALGWRLLVMSTWAHDDIAAVLGLDRRHDFEDAEAEEPELIALVSAADGPLSVPVADTFVELARAAEWQGHANRLSPTHVAWPAIDLVSSATREPGEGQTPPAVATGRVGQQDGELSARRIFLQRRSATGFDPRGVLRRDAFLAMLARLSPDGIPWDATVWKPQVHLAIFVHRVQDLLPGMYAYIRADDGTLADWRQRMRADFLWEPIPETAVAGTDGLFLLAPLDVRAVAHRLSCDQDIASDGFFSLGMVARFATVREQGSWWYRRLFWECGLIGQVLYLEAEVAGARATGIGCFYDDPVHEVLGLADDTWQSLYHFSMGLPLEDTRLTTEPGYDWEK